MMMCCLLQEDKASNRVCSVREDSIQTIFYPVGGSVKANIVPIGGRNLYFVAQNLNRRKMLCPLAFCSIDS